MRSILREAKDPERLQSGVRKWLTYIALFITAATMICDLIFFLSSFLRGELTSRFVLKTATVMLISGAIFARYFGFLRWKRTSLPVRVRPRTNGFAITATAAVAITFCGGFLISGAPSHQRHLEADSHRIADLRRIAAAVNSWHDRAARNSSMPALPSSLDELNTNGLLTKHMDDPETNQPYVYRPMGTTRYKLCATFTAPTRETESAYSAPASGFWNHGRGTTCFVLAAGEPVPW